MADSPKPLAYTREGPHEALALLELILRVGGLKALHTRERPDQYFLLLLNFENWEQDSLPEFLKEFALLKLEQTPAILCWLEEELGLEDFTDRWHQRFHEIPTPEAFWLWLAKKAICAETSGCLSELCQLDAYDFAHRLKTLAPNGCWLCLRRRKTTSLQLDPCQSVILERLKRIWHDEVSRKLKRRAAEALDRFFAERLSVDPERFIPHWLGIPVWYPKITAWLNDLHENAQRCDSRPYIEVHLPTFPQIFDELTAPALQKRKGCRQARPGLPFWAAASRSYWPRTYEKALEGYQNWGQGATSFEAHKRFFPQWPDLFELQEALSNQLEEWLTELGGPPC